LLLVVEAMAIRRRAWRKKPTGRGPMPAPSVVDAGALELGGRSRGPPPVAGTRGGHGPGTGPWGHRRRHDGHGARLPKCPEVSLRRRRCDLGLDHRKSTPRVRVCALAPEQPRTNDGAAGCDVEHARRAPRPPRAPGPTTVGIWTTMPHRTQLAAPEGRLEARISRRWRHRRPRRHGRGGFRSARRRGGAARECSTPILNHLAKRRSGVVVDDHDATPLERSLRPSGAPRARRRR